VRVAVLQLLESLWNGSDNSVKLQIILELILIPLLRLVLPSGCPWHNEPEIIDASGIAHEMKPEKRMV
jgi:hypothetical protein